MIEINVTKIMSFFFIVSTSFIVSLTGSSLFGWDLQVGLMIGLILGSWSSIYDLAIHILEEKDLND